MTQNQRDLVQLRQLASRRAFLRGSVAVSAGGAALYALACGGGGDDPAATATATPGSDRTPVTTPSADGTPVSGIRPSLVTSEFVANENNRFAIGLLGPDGDLLKDANVHLRFFKLGDDGVTGSLRGEGDMQYVELRVDGENAETISFYAVNAPFGEAGKWGVDIAVTPQSGEPATVQVPFEVRTAFATPANGTLPPASLHDTVATATIPESICSRSPQCDLHDKVIADVLGKGRPLVVQFSTPAYCQTRFCGPVLDVLLADVPAYRDRIDFIHIEVWEDFQAQRARPAVQEWKLPTEPYTFFMGADGNVQGRLEAIFSNEELRAKLDGLLSA